jgi:hypothetical protein
MNNDTVRNVRFPGFDRQNGSPVFQDLEYPSDDRCVRSVFTSLCSTKASGHTALSGAPAGRSE